jgi:hypothetical protein
MIMEPAKSNIINCGGRPLTDALIRFADGFGHAFGQKVKLVNIGTFRYTPEYLAMRERQEEWLGI